MKNTCSQAGEQQRKLVAYARRIIELEQHLAAANALIEQACVALAEAIRLRSRLCENGDDNSPPTPALNYDKPVQHWTKTLAAIERHQKEK